MRHDETVRSFADIDVTYRSAVLCDLDGCLISGEHVHEGARAFVEACGDRLWIVSNNSSDTAETLAGRLAELGLTVSPQRVLLAGEETVRRVAEDGQKARAAVYADPPLRALANCLGIVGEPAAPDLVLIGRDRRFGLRMMEEIAAHIVGGVEVWVTNLDRFHPAASGNPVPETGAIVAAVEACTGPFPIRSIGKPAPDLIEIALRRSGAERGRALFVGDNAATDGEAARAAGVAFARILHPPIATGGFTARHPGGSHGVSAC